jgi:mannan endo-1,4-beta-mannosidase
MAAGCGEDDEPDVEAQASACDAALLAPLPGEDRHLVALNAYFLQEEAARALRRGEPGSAVVDEVLSKAAALGASAVRTNAFNDGPEKAGDSAMQVAPLEYDEVSLRGLDLVLARASAHGVRLVLPLGNYWDDFGGARQYVAWAGLPAPREGDARFFTDPRVVAMYRAHVARLLDRVNTFDGRRYGDHPAVLAWELLNEPRGDGLDREGRAMRAWVDEVASHVKRLAPGHLVGTGEEGLDSRESGAAGLLWQLFAPWMFEGGSSFALNSASPWVDYASVHLFPESWGVPHPWVPAAGASWIDGHARVARAIGKPLVIGEFGVQRTGGLTLAERRAVYAGWFRCARTTGAAAAAPWMLANDARPAEWDSHAFYWRTGTDPADPVNEYADLVRAAADAAASVSANPATSASLAPRRP